MSLFSSQSFGRFVGALTGIALLFSFGCASPGTERAQRGVNQYNNGLRQELKSVWVDASGKPLILKELIPEDESLNGEDATRYWEEKLGAKRVYTFIPWDGSEAKEIHGLASSIHWSAYGIIIPRWYSENGVNSPFNDFAVTYYYPVTGVAVTTKDLLAHYAAEYQALMTTARLEVLPEEPPADYQQQAGGTAKIPNPPVGARQHPNSGLPLPVANNRNGLGGDARLASGMNGGRGRQAAFDGGPDDPRWRWHVKNTTRYPRSWDELANTVPPQ